MKTMFRQIADKLSAGKDLVMVTVIASSGSTPRGAGARMLIDNSGRLCGTIGGGAVEFRSQQIAAQVLADKNSFAHSFTLTKDDVQKLGMICGGDVSVFFHFISAGDEAALALVQKAEEQYIKKQNTWLISDIGNGGKLGLYTDETGYFGIDAPDWLTECLSRRPVRLVRDGRDLYVEQIISSGMVYVFGCGHIAQELVPVLSHVGFRCVALDDRPEFADKKLFPTAEDVILCNFNRIGDYITLTDEDYACVMTRGHAFDATVQAQILQSPACYIGVIGSARKKAGVYAKLKEEYGFSDEVFQRITSPIGLSIGAETPAEIAVSIAGQMIQIRAERNKH